MSDRNEPVPTPIIPPLPSQSWTTFWQGIIAMIVTAIISYQMNQVRSHAEEAAKAAKEAVVKTEESSAERDKKLAILEKTADVTQSLVKTNSIIEAKHYAKASRALNVLKPDNPEFKKDAEIADKVVKDHEEVGRKIEKDLKEKLEASATPPDDKKDRP